MKTAVRKKILDQIISNHTRGRVVIWDDVVKDVEVVLTGYYAVDKINYLLPIKITDETRYVRTKEELAKLLGVARSTLQRWEAGRIIEIKKTYRLRLGCKGYDAKNVAEQINFRREWQKYVKGKRWKFPSSKKLNATI